MNNVREIREARMLSKTELARRAGISLVTLDRIEQGKDCRIGTQRKILLALGLGFEDRAKVFQGEKGSLYAPRQAPRTTAHRPEGPPEGRRLFQGLRVLLAGFIGSDAEWLRARLEEWGCSLDSTPEGPQSLAAYRTNRPDLVLMDANMPSGNGFDASEEIMELDRQARILLLAGPDDTRLARKALESGLVKLVLPKPLDSHQLRIAMEEVIKASRTFQEIPARESTVA